MSDGDYKTLLKKKSKEFLYDEVLFQNDRAAKATDRIRKLEYIIRETLWMARRYADGRRTYAPGTVNEAIDLALELGIDIAGPTEPIYATDGDLGEWNPDTGKFEKE